jgi:hypothetical protein
MLTAVSLGLALVSLGVASAQQLAPPQLLDWSADDGKRVADLAARGRRIDGTEVVVWTPVSVSEADQRALVARLDRGVAAVRAMIGKHAWQVVGGDKITYYVSEDRFPSHATARAAVFIPLARVQDDRAPYLHEAVHELLSTAATRKMIESPGMPSQPIWFAEGIADYIAGAVAAKAGLTGGDVFDIGGLDRVDRTCAERLKGPAGSDVLPFIGAHGAPVALYTADRAKVAPAFYACSFSFTKFIVERVGLAPIVAAAPLVDTEGLHAQFEKLLGKSLSAASTDWLREIGYRN